MIEWGIASKLIQGETVSGDRSYIRSFSNHILFSVIDGLGHGKEAASAAEQTVSILEEHAHEPLASIFNLCNKGLRTTRGVVMSIASYDILESTITWSGIGNVEGTIWGAHKNSEQKKQVLLLKNGIIGWRFSTPRVSVLPIQEGSTLIFATDGIRSEFTNEPIWDLAPQALADSILAQYSKDTDDALVLVVKFGGHSP
jgi:negative regulator of sigma-B (phosphoserine phosphatase)